jgi:hypothetical protein
MDCQPRFGMNSPHQSSDRMCGHDCDTGLASSASITKSDGGKRRHSNTGASSMTAGSEWWQSSQHFMGVPHLGNDLGHRRLAPGAEHDAFVTTVGNLDPVLAGPVFGPAETALHQTFSAIEE